MSGPERRSATIRDVARLSGVSIATVTRTFQESPRVRPETSERVKAAAAKLGYRPDALAQALVTGRSNTIGLLVPSLQLAYWGEVADAIEHRAGDLGYSLIVASSRWEPERERAMLDLLFGKRLDGIVVAGPVGDPRAWPSDGPAPPPLVLIEWDATPQWDLLEELTNAPLSARSWRFTAPDVRGDWVGHVYYDDVGGGQLVARHLLEQGHERIGFVAGLPVRTCLLRLLGVRSAIEDSGRALHSVRAGENSFEGGRALGHELLSSSDRPTALACYSDEMAIGVIRAAHELGLDVPGDVSVAGFDDIKVASYIDPPLTTIRNPIRGLGEQALELILRAQAGEGDRVEETLAGSLVVRGSTGPAPKVGARRPPSQRRPKAKSAAS